MKHITNEKIEQGESTVVTLGNFDGMHQGHRVLISLTKKFAEDEGLISVVYTFSPHPMFLFKNRDHAALVMAPKEKECTVKEMGIDVYIEYPFTTEFANWEPERFAREIVFGKLNCKILVVGDDYRFGKKQLGNTKMLSEIGYEYGAKVVCVPPVLFNQERVSSTRIRNYLIGKNIDMANRLLVCPYFIFGTVVEGKRLGRKLGFPTMNIIADKDKLFPPNGVYATRTLYNGNIYSGVTNIGYNPTVSGTTKIVETFLFDFYEIIYGEMLKIYFFEWIREEEKFPSIKELKSQLERDVVRAKDYFLSDNFKFWSKKY